MFLIDLGLFYYEKKFEKRTLKINEDFIQERIKFHQAKDITEVSKDFELIEGEEILLPEVITWSYEIEEDVGSVSKRTVLFSHLIAKIGIVLIAALLVVISFIQNNILFVVLWTLVTILHSIALITIVFKFKKEL